MSEPTKGPRDSRQKEVGDLAFAGYAHMKGIPLLKATRNRTEFLFVFDDPGDQLEALNLDFTNSEFANYDAAIRRLKKLCNRGYN